MDGLSYRREVQTKPPYDLVCTGSYYEGDLHSGNALAGEEYTVLHRQDFSHIEDAMVVGITAYMTSFLDDLVDSIDESDGGTKVVQSGFLEAIAVVSVTHTSQLRTPAHTSAGNP